MKNGNTNQDPRRHPGIPTGGVVITAMITTTTTTMSGHPIGASLTGSTMIEGEEGTGEGEEDSHPPCIEVTHHHPHRPTGTLIEGALLHLLVGTNISEYLLY